MGVVSAATVEPPELKRRNDIDVYANPKDEATQRMVCRSILIVATKMKLRKLVLGAIGCGASCHPVAEAVRTWIEVLGDLEFKRGFENVTFAVLSRGEPTRRDPSYNLTAFQQGLQNLLVEGEGAKHEEATQLKRKRVTRLNIDAAKLNMISPDQDRLQEPGQAPDQGRAIQYEPAESQSKRRDRDEHQGQKAVRKFENNRAQDQPTEHVSALEEDQARARPLLKAFANEIDRFKHL